MAKILLILVLLVFTCSAALFIYDKIVHPLFFSEEIEDTLETAAEEKIRRDVKKQAKKILGGDDVIE